MSAKNALEPSSGVRLSPAGDCGVPAGVSASVRATQGFKRALDVVFALILFAISLPVLLVAGLAIKLDSPGSVLYLQWRGGRSGVPFRILKLRTMVDEADQFGPELTQESDPRITRVGSWLRRWSVDELPQLLNVIAGQMSLVGPRPELVSIVASYEPWQRPVLDVRPGLTGWAQVNGRDDLSISEKLHLELDYVTNYNLIKDFAILVRTAGVVISGCGTKR
jgi:lipopolysaccharide/colanic/teichoic acid biosynthesis glycosyltransferase